MGDEDELEALRLAALATLRAKSAAQRFPVPRNHQQQPRHVAPYRHFQSTARSNNQVFQRHHINSNLIAIVPVADTSSAAVSAPSEPPRLALPQHRYCKTEAAKPPEAQPTVAVVTKFDRYDKSDSESDSESERSVAASESESEDDVLMMADEEEEKSLDQLISQLEDPLAARTAVVKPMLVQSPQQDRPSPEHQRMRSKSPVRQPIRTKSPVRQPMRRSRSPVRQPMRRSRSPVRQPMRRSPVRQPMRRSRSPVRQPMRRSRSPVRQPIRSRSPIRQPMRSKSPNTTNNIRPWSPPLRARSPRPMGRRNSRSPRRRSPRLARRSRSPRARWSPRPAPRKHSNSPRPARRRSNSPPRKRFSRSPKRDRRASNDPSESPRRLRTPSLSLSPSPDRTRDKTSPLRPIVAKMSPVRIKPLLEQSPVKKKKHKSSQKMMDARRRKFESNEPIATETKVIRLRPEAQMSEVKSRLGPLVKDEASEVKSRLGHSDVIGEAKRSEPMGSEVKSRLGTVVEDSAEEDAEDSTSVEPGEIVETNDSAAANNSTNQGSDLRAELSRRRAERLTKKSLAPALVGSRLVQSAILDLVNRNPRGVTDRSRNLAGAEGCDSLRRKVKLKRSANQVFENPEPKKEKN